MIIQEAALICTVILPRIKSRSHCCDRERIFLKLFDRDLTYYRNSRDVGLKHVNITVSNYDIFVVAALIITIFSLKLIQS